MSVQILQGDCREVLKTLAAESVDCIVTSPPYYGLRDYGTARWQGGDEGCNHLLPVGQRQDVGRTNVDGFNGSAKPSVLSAKAYLKECGKCGATRIDSQIGLEATPDAYVKELVSVFGECRRVLKNSGTLWLNLGDSYAGGGRGGNPAESAFRKQATNVGSLVAASPVPPGCKPKDLIGIPWMVAFALRADGWYLRSDIIWSKPNPMPENVTDRPTKAHEYLFLLSKSARYFYDGDAVRVPYSEGSLGRYETPLQSTQAGARQPGKEWKPETSNFGPNPLGRNIRSVWTITTQPFSEAHFATFPPDLIEPCIKAGCPPYVCGECGTSKPLHQSNDDACHYTKYGTVLDPFGGAGTTALVADRLRRNAILIELNPEYAAMSERRLNGDAGMFASVERQPSLLDEAVA